ncbi:hypothetical protein ASPCAL01700 [Aspergillus calidoustus]|uniref:RNase III domain-containing protein n=1 Tax=Aspergillus calidoustus TaxID=454130 RepID=A0A0U5GMQ6_ASPCI|nr:hypothetical protein ASPCAL01700 [Aspergillus calidoustus]
MKFPRSALRLASCRPAFRSQIYHAWLRPVVLQRFQSSIPPEQTPWNLETPAPRPSTAAVGVVSQSAGSEDPVAVSETVDVSLDSPPVDSEVSVEVYDFDEELGESSDDIPGLVEDEAYVHRASEDIPDLSPDPTGLSGRVIAFMERFHLELENPDLLVRALRCRSLRATDDARSLSFVGDAVFRLYAATLGQEKGHSVGQVAALTKVLYSNKALARQAWRLRLDETANLRHILATSADYKKDTLEILLATTLEAVVGAVFIDKKHSLHDTIPFLTALGLNISEKNTPKFISKIPGNRP